MPAPRAALLPTRALPTTHSPDPKLPAAAVDLHGLPHLLGSGPGPLGPVLVLVLVLVRALSPVHPNALQPTHAAPAAGAHVPTREHHHGGCLGLSVGEGVGHAWGRA
jgi:hypothetical protein